jgi:DNA-damage-inducible protein J
MLQKIPFEIRRDNPNIETIAAMDEFYEIKKHPQNYKKYSSFRDAMNDVWQDA